MEEGSTPNQTQTTPPAENQAAPETPAATTTEQQGTAQTTPAAPATFVDDKQKAYWISQGLKEDDFKDSATFNAAAIKIYDERIRHPKEKQDNLQTGINQPQTTTQTPAQQTTTQTQQTPNVDLMGLQNEAIALSDKFERAYPNVDKQYIEDFTYMKEMTDMGLPAVINGHVNTTAAMQFLNMQDRAAAGDKLVEAGKHSNAANQPTAPLTIADKVADDDHVQTMTKAAADNILFWSAKERAAGRQGHPQEAEAAAFMRDLNKPKPKATTQQ